MSVTNFVQSGMSPDAVNRRAGGRRRINAERRAKAQARHYQMVQAHGLNLLVWSPRGLQSQLAEQWQVSRATICRDIEAIREGWRRDNFCSKCGRAFRTLDSETIANWKKARWYREALKEFCTPKKCGAKVRAERLRQEMREDWANS